jgi:hypothetical protein
MNQIIADISNSISFKEKNEIKDIFWTTKEFEKLVPSCYHIKLNDTEKGIEIIEQNYLKILKFYSKFKYYIYIDCHRFISNEKIIFNFINFLKDNQSIIKVFSSPVLYLNKSYYRKHIKNECDNFVSYFKKAFENEIIHQLYFENSELSMKIHFDLIYFFDL